jgi:molybdopterin/thiamine biosynthesis adenylyltransferase/rhodanese-related sulfurtransferase
VADSSPVTPNTGSLTAIVEPGPPLTTERLARFSRQVLMPGFGELAQRRLANARVLVVGGGGLGSASIPYLASAGVGTIGVVDTDVVELSNLHRQVIHGMCDIGRSKVDSISDAVAAIDPEITVNQHEVWLDSSNIMDILIDYDLVLDGSDNFATRYLTNDAAALSHKPLVWGAILRYDGQVGVAFANHGPSYRDLFPIPPDASEVLSCSVGGVLPHVCAVIGAIMSAEAIKLITGIGQPLIGRIISYDALNSRFREVDYEAIPDADPIGELIDYAAFCGVMPAAPVEEKARSLTIDVLELSQRLRAGMPMQLIDVREPSEAKIASIEQSELIPLGRLEHSLDQIRADVPVVVYCHHGPRAEYAVTLLRNHGFRNVELLEGGVDAFARLVDTSLVRY